VRVTAPSTCAWLDHSVSGLIRQTRRPIKTRFRSAYTSRLKLACQTNSLTHYTKGTQSHPKVLLLLVGVRFQVSFTPLIGVLFTFPSRYLFTIGHMGVLRLGGWSPHVQTGFHVPRPTQVRPIACPYGTVTRYGPTFQMVPVQLKDGTGLVPVRSPLLGESLLMSFPPATEMFQFTGFAS
jgi:hypothetical protein